MPRGDRARRARGPRGFTYLGVLAVVVLIGVLLAAAGTVAATDTRRDRETQLLWVGHEYRDAIGRYWRTRHAYPQTLQDLLGTGPDDPIPMRFLRQLYPDPMTNAVDWVLVLAPGPGGGIMGVASRSAREPLRKAHFDDVDVDFAVAKTYGDWAFTWVPVRRRVR
jgi:type II secretory pathway pseudopilin PulG